MSFKEETVPNPLDGERETHREICRALNIDADTEMQSWRSYERARDQYDLTGNAKHWMCCALYVACLQELPAVGHPDHFIQGNGVNITNLLSQCNINIQEFFNKMSHWAEIRSLPTHLQLVVKNLNHEFSVAYRTYAVFSEAFPRIFNEANIVPDEPKRNKKSKPNPCSYNKLREFSWLLFLTVKEQHKEQRHDFTTALDLFVCVMDLIYRNVVTDGRMDLINPNVLSDGGSSSIDGAAEAAMRVNVRELLCSEYPTLVESVDETNANIFLPSLSGLLDARDLKATRVTTDGGATTYTGLVSVSNFEENLKLFNRRYERSILRCGMLDERIALNSRISPTSQQRNRWTVHPRTPLSIKSGQSGTGAALNMNRAGLVADLPTNGAFVVRGTLTQLLKKIQGHSPGQPRDTFHALMQNCTPSPLPTVLEHVVRMRKRFVDKLTGNEGWNARSAESRFVAIEALYYQLLENIIPWELKKRPTMVVSKAIFDLCSNSIFNETLIVCAAEVIFFLRQEQHNFPWILEVFGMQPFQFFNIIEVTVSSNSDIFTSDIVNHLRRIEEQLVDSISWKSSSVLWECMEKENYQIPENKDVEQRAAIAGVTPLKADSVPNTPNGTRGHAANGSNDSHPISSFSSPQRSTNDHHHHHPPSIETRRLNFFFRKMYQVAYDRLCNLCQNLGIDTEDIQKLIWTILEFTITKRAKELMRDRHLDQLLMCAVFVTMRIKKLPNTFKQIMHCYHSQPQANSSIYRSVFIRHENGTPPSEESGGANGEQQQQQQQQSAEPERLPVTEMAGTSVQYDREVYGDIIKFYNDIYVRTVHQFALQYYNTDISQASLFLSPTPKSQVRNIQKSPRQFSSGMNLYVSTTNKINSLKGSPNVRVLTFPSSPGQSPTIHDRKVPVLVREKPGGTVVRKLTEPTAFEPALPSKLRRLDKIHQERQHQDHESSENE
ncbi:retinoblastoma-like protein 2 isoform X2 [Anopheles stephensi]|uniref:retinoblastoma-like protein 2 isoform X2 n=1 Tax=Anopheles stephensi TaxID=30069 RepID=UPI001658914C|nr:retinoblastoma-like protein 2 isoform X2 [Anopheles stephensi]